MDLEVRWEEAEPDLCETAERRKEELLGVVRNWGGLREVVGGMLPGFFQMRALFFGQEIFDVDD